MNIKKYYLYHGLVAVDNSKKVNDLIDICHHLIKV